MWEESTPSHSPHLVHFFHLAVPESHPLMINLYSRNSLPEFCELFQHNIKPEEGLVETSDLELGVKTRLTTWAFIWQQMPEGGQRQTCGTEPLTCGT